MATRKMVVTIPLSGKSLTTVAGVSGLNTIMLLVTIPLSGKSLTTHLFLNNTADYNGVTIPLSGKSLTTVILIPGRYGFINELQYRSAVYHLQRLYSRNVAMADEKLQYRSAVNHLQLDGMIWYIFTVLRYNTAQR